MVFTNLKELQASNCALTPTPMEALVSASKCNTIPDKQHNLLNSKVENNNTIMKLLTHKINPAT
jgi:hypothetical protein